MCLGGKPLSIGSGARSGRANYRRASNPINWGHPAEGSLVGNRFSRGHGGRAADSSMRRCSICRLEPRTQLRWESIGKVGHRIVIQDPDLTFPCKADKSEMRQEKVLGCLSSSTCLCPIEFTELSSDCSKF